MPDAGAMRILLSRTAAVLAAMAAAALQAAPTSGQQDIRVASVRIAGLDTVAPPISLPGRLPLRPGVRYTSEAIEATERILRIALAERGYPHAVVEVAGAVDYPTATADVLFDVDPGPRARFGEVRVQAPAPLREADVWARVAYEPGDRFRTSAVERTHRALLGLPGVEEVFIDLPGLGTGDTLLVSVIRVVPPERMAAVGGRVTLSSIECLEVSGGWRHRHFLGAPRVFSVSGGFSSLFASILEGDFPCGSAGEDTFAQPNYYLGLDLFEPVRADRMAAVEASLTFRRRTAPQAYLVQGFGLRLGATYEVRPDIHARITYAPERYELRAAGHYFCANFGACDDVAIDVLSGWRWLSPLETAATWIPPAARHPFGPPWVREAGLWPGTAGPFWRPTAHATISGAAGPTGSDFAYLRAELSAAVAHVLSPRTEIAARIRTGALLASDDVLPPQVRFYGGGPNSVRGARQNLLGPLVLVARPQEALEAGCTPEPSGCPPHATPTPDRVSVRPRGGRVVGEASLEGRLWITRSFQLAAFADAGAVRADAHDANANGADAHSTDSPSAVPATSEWETLVAPGLGFRWLSPLGPLRLDFGYDPRGPRSTPMLLQNDMDGGLIDLGHVEWDPYARDDGWRAFWRRLSIHLAVGQAF